MGEKLEGVRNLLGKGEDGVEEGFSVGSARMLCHAFQKQNSSVIQDGGGPSCLETGIG